MLSPSDVYTDPHCVVVQPRETRPLSDELRTQVAKHLASQHGVTIHQIRPFIPSVLQHWGKLQWLKGGDMMHASEMVKHGTRDMSYVKVSLD